MTSKRLSADAVGPSTALEPISALDPDAASPQSPSAFLRGAPLPAAVTPLTGAALVAVLVVERSAPSVLRAENTTAGWEDLVPDAPATPGPFEAAA